MGEDVRFADDNLVQRCQVRRGRRTREEAGVGQGGLQLVENSGVFGSEDFSLVGASLWES